MLKGRSIGFVSFRSTGAVARLAAVSVLVALAGALVPVAQAAPPPASTPRTPGPAVATTARPVFSWSSVLTASWYRIWVQKDGAFFHSEWFFGETQTTLPNDLTQGEYTWWVQTLNPDGAGPWSAASTFRVSFPYLNTPVGTSEQEYGDGHMRFDWLGDRFTTWYRLVVTRLQAPVYDRWLAAAAPYGYGMADYTSGLGDTNHTAWLDTAQLDLGIYAWSVQEWRSGDPTTAASAGRAFWVEGCFSAPPKPVVTVDNDFWPFSAWGETNAPRPEAHFYTDDAEWYRLYIARDGTTVLDKWVQSSWWRSPSDFVPGDYEVQVQAWNRCGLSDWSEAAPFKVAYTAPAGHLSPHFVYGYGFGYGGRLLENTRLTALSWDMVPNAYWYQVYLSRNGAPFRDEWHNLGARDDFRHIQGVNVAVASPTTLPAGDYSLWVRAWNPLGGLWSTRRDYVVPALDPVTLLSPTGMSLSSVRQVELDWTIENQDADQYRVYVSSSGGTYLDKVVPARGPVIYTESRGAGSFLTGGTATGWKADNAIWTFALPFSFPFGGTTYTACLVDSNGALYFGGSQSPMPNIVDFRRHRMIAVMWADLDTSAGDVYVTSGTHVVSVRWVGQTRWSGLPINIAVLLHSDGQIQLRYGDGNEEGGMVGVSGGYTGEYTLASYHETGSLRNKAPLNLSPHQARWVSHWDFAPGSYTWWVQPLRNAGREKGPWSAPAMFRVP